MRAAPARGRGLKRASDFAARAGLLLAALVVSSLALELGLRAFWDGFYLKGERSYLVPSATRGWANRPDTVATYGEPEFHFSVSHNALGFRGPEAAPENPKGSTRVLVLGDSFSYGIGVADDETFSARLAAREPGLEVLNSGVNGYGTAQELLLLRDQGLALRPDVVVVAFFWNDVGNSYGRAFPRFELDGDALRWPEPLEVVPSSVGGRRRSWLRHSYAYRFLSDRLKIAGFRISLLLGLPLETSDFVDERERDEAWRLISALLREIRDRAAGVGARVAVARIPDQVEVEPDVEVVGLDPADYGIGTRLQETCDALDLPLIDLLPALRAERGASDEPLYYPKDRHLRPRAHAVVAVELATALRRLGLLPDQN